MKKIPEMVDDLKEGNFDDYDANVLCSVLAAADELYHNGDDELLFEDHEYDTVRLYAYNLDPTHVYFIGIGSKVRGGKVDLPFEMGSLNQTQIGDIADWIGNWSLQNKEVVISDKMDGTSAMVIYDDNGKSQIAYSRGDGVQGADISRHIFKFKNVPNQISGKLVLRGEVELTETAFQKLRTIVFRRDGSQYKNARNMVAGLMNASTAKNPIIYDYLTLVTYQVLNQDQMSKVSHLKLLDDEGFQVVDYSVKKGSELTDNMLADYLNDRRDNIDYDIDGLVIEVNGAKKRTEMVPTRDTLNPAYATKYKVADASNVAIATVVGVEWNISKHSYLKPKIQIEPVDLVGVTIQNCTGFNAKFIKENGIGPGAKIQITRSGDVIPFCQKVIEPAIPQLPGSMNPAEIDWDWEWSESGVDAVLKNADLLGDAGIGQAVDFFASIKVTHLKDGNIKKLFEVGKTSIADIINMDERELVSAIGKNGEKVYAGIRTRLGSIELYRLAGATTLFGRGVGVRKFKKLFEALRLHVVDEMPLLNVSQITSVAGFESTTAKKIVSGMGDFMSFYESISHHVTLVTNEPKGSVLEGEKVVMTGFRDAALGETIEQQGGTVQSSVSGKTTIVIAGNPNSASGKIKKARDLGIRVMGKDEFMEMLDGSK